MKKLSLLIIIFGQAFAASFYVSKTGNDNNQGTASAPWLTVQRAANSAQAGDTVNVGDGVFPENINQTNAGKPGQPIIYSGNGSTTIVGGFNVQSPYVTVQSMALNGAGVAPLDGLITLSPSASNCSFSKLSLSGNAGSTADGYGAVMMIYPGPSNCIFDQLSVTDMNYTWFTLYGSSNVVSGCKMTGTAGWDVFRVFGMNHIIRGNDITSSNSDTTLGRHPDFFQSYVDSDKIKTQGILFERNTFHGTGQVDDVQIGNITDDGQTGLVSGWIFRNNVFYNIDRTLNLYAPNFQFYNNTFYRCSVSSGWVIIMGKSTAGSAAGAVITNNIFAESGYATRANAGWYDSSDVGAAATADSNLVYGVGAGLVKDTGWTANGHEAHGLNGSPVLFVGPTNFNLQAASPAIGKGQNLSAFFTTDITGATRTDPWDIGAYKVAGSVVVPPVVVPPIVIPPTNAKITSSVSTISSDRKTITTSITFDKPIN